MDYRNGDVYLKKVDQLPEGLKPAPDNVLARGEVTGHDHCIVDGEVFVDETGKLFVRAVKGKTSIRHQDQSGAVAEHLPIELDEGLYEVNIERNFDPEKERRVID